MTVFIDGSPRDLRHLHLRQEHAIKTNVPKQNQEFY